MPARRKFCAQKQEGENKKRSTRQDIGQKVKLAENRSAPSRSRSRSLAFFDRRHFLRNISSKCVPGVTFNIKGGRGSVGRGPWAVGVPAATTYKLALLLRHFVVRIKQQRAEKVYKMKQQAVRQVQAEKQKKRNCLRKENPKAGDKASERKRRRRRRSRAREPAVVQ